MRIMVGLSGGVDSAVSTMLLGRAGVEVVSAFIKTWQPEWTKCTWREERRDAMRVAAHLDIPFITIDLEREYKESVADYMIAEYRLGRTPNPDVMCNKEIKFGAFLKRALVLGADAIATGHYARNSPRGELLRGVDPAKDQSYFLWTLTQEQLSKVIFPIGYLLKSEVRELAKQFKLPVADKRDSQGICFLGHIDMRDFLSHYIKSEPGKVLDAGGLTIGEHDGAVFYTIGQAWKRPLYVLAKDINKNTLTVGKLVDQNRKPGFRYNLKDVNWIAGSAPEASNLVAQIRYHGEKLACTVSDNTVTFTESVLIAPGQSVVIYAGDVCLGGGVVE